MKNFTRKSSKLTRSGCKNTPLSLPKRDGQKFALRSPPALCTPTQFPTKITENWIHRFLGWVWWDLIEQSRPENFGNFTQI